MSTNKPLLDDKGEPVLVYPCTFPIKVMGIHDNTFEAQIIALTLSHDPQFDAVKHLERRPSSSGKYLGLTVTVLATSREQLDALYRAYTGHPLVRYVL
jgi:uncharacterized protein